MIGLRRLRATIRRDDGAPRAVRTLRVALPLGAAALAGLLLAWPHLFSHAPNRASIDAAAPAADGGSTTMRAASYLGRTADDTPYVVRAETAQPGTDAAEQVLLDSVITEMAGEHPVELSARDAELRLKDKAILLKGGIELRLTDGQRVRTERAQVDLDDGRIEGDRPVEVDGPEGTLSADRFEVIDSGATLRFQGRVRAVLSPPKEEAREAEPTRPGAAS